MIEGLSILMFLESIKLSQMPVWTAIDPAIRAPIAVSLGAIPGALIRYYLTLLAGRSGIPAYGTFFVNVTGSILIGFSSTLIAKLAVIPDVHWLVVVGFLGAYTTFSTYALDTSNLLQTKGRRAALVYWLGSAAVGFAAVKLGIYIGLSHDAPRSLLCF